MSSRDRDAGHVLCDEADFTRLRDLPAGVGFQVLRHGKGRKPAFFVGTRVLRDMRWPKGDDPFAEFAPVGAPQFVQAAVATAAPFVRAFDWLHGRMSEIAPGYPVLGPAARVGELSLGLQIATLLGRPVLSYLSDADYDAELACVSEPDRVARVRCLYAGLHLLFDGGAEVQACAAVDHDNVQEFLRGVCSLPGVRKVRKPSGLTGATKSIGCEELDRFVGAPIADEMQITPDWRKMVPVAQRTGTGEVKRL